MAPYHFLSSKNHPGTLSDFLLKQNLQLRQSALLLATIITLISSAMDFIRFPPEVYQITLVTRFVLVLAPLFVLNVLFFRSPPKTVMQYVPLLMAAYIGAGLNHSIVYYYAAINEIVFSEVGLILILMFGCLLIMLPIFIATIGTFVIILVYAMSHFIVGHDLGDLFFSTTVMAFISSLFIVINLFNQRVLTQNFDLISTLHQDSITDELTKLYNKRFFEEQTHRVVELSQRNQCNIALVLIDIDHFKSINDQHGHVIGDKILIDIANEIRRQSRRPSDFSCRIGGDELAIVLFDASLEKVEQVCKELIATSKFPKFYPPLAAEIVATLSIGACIKQGDSAASFTSLLELADQCLYDSKKNGRNQYSLQTA